MRHKFSHLMTQSCEVLMLQFPKRTWDDKQEDGESLHCTIPCYGKHSGPKSSNFQSYLPKYNKFPGEIQMFYNKFKPLINRISLACLPIPISFSVYSLSLSFFFPHFLMIPPKCSNDSIAPGTYLLKICSPKERIETPGSQRYITFNYLWKDVGSW